MKMTFNELKVLIKEAAKEVKQDLGKDMSWASVKNADNVGKKGRDGYQKNEDEDEQSCQPNGYSASEAADFSERLSDTTNDGNLYKKQGSANFGPWTNETFVRNFIKKSIMNEFAKKKGTLLNKRINISEGSVWNSLRSLLKGK